MYFIKSENDILHSIPLSEKSYVVLDPKIGMELNRISTLSFVLTVGNPNYDKIQLMKKDVFVWDGVNRIFRGRAVAIETDFYLQKSVTCEDEVGFLNDVIVRPYTFTGGVSDFYRKLIHEYNKNADKKRRFGTYTVNGAQKPATELTDVEMAAATAATLTPGSCTVTDPNNTITRANKAYPTVYEEINSKLVELLGGYLMPRYENGVDYLDYVADSGTEDTTQKIRFAENLLDLTQNDNGDELFTVIVPLGKDVGQGDAAVPLTITGETTTGYEPNIVIAGDSIVDKPAVERHGRIERIMVWNDVTVKSNLVARGTAAIRAAGVYNEIELAAVDMHDFDSRQNRLKLGNYYRLVSVPHGYISDGNSNKFQLGKISLDLAKPNDSQYIFSRAFTAKNKDISRMVGG